MKNSIYNKRNVPSIHTGCSLAETGAGDYDNFDAPLGALDITEGMGVQLVEERNQRDGFDGPYVEVKVMLPPQVQNPADVREEPLVKITVPSGVHPIALLNPDVINHAWIILNKDVVENLKEFSYKFQQDTIAYGEFFRLENNDSFYLQKVEYFEGWRVLRECKINDETFQIPECPEFIIEMMME